MKPSVRTATHRLFAAGLFGLGIAAAAYGTLRVTFGPRPVSIHVRWAPGVEDTVRQEAEQRYHLSEGELLEGRTWAYTLNDRSRTNIRALVSDAVIEDTHDIDRSALALGLGVIQNPRTGPQRCFRDSPEVSLQRHLHGGWGILEVLGIPVT